MCVKFQPSIPDSFRDTRGLKFTLGGAVPPANPLAENFSYSKSVLDPKKTYVKFQLSICNSFRDMTRSQIYPSGAADFCPCEM